MNNSNIDAVAKILVDIMINIEEIRIVEGQLVVTFFDKYGGMNAAYETIPEENDALTRGLFAQKILNKIMNETHPAYLSNQAQ